MAVALPTNIAPQDITPSFVDFGGELTPILGGVSQRINRLGNRWGVQVSMPPLDLDEARLWVSRLVQARGTSALLPWPQPADVGAEGAPRVNGAGQTGKVLAVKGLPAGKVVKEGWFFSIVTAGRRRIYMVAADATASAGGGATLMIEPMLRVRPADNDVIELAAPMIEGAVQGDTSQWSVNLMVEVGLSFALVERG